MTDREIILHGLRDRDDDSRIALRRIAERCERAEADVSRMQSLFDEESRIRREWAIRAEKAEARVRELETRFGALISAKDSGLFYVEVETPCAFEDVHAERVERVEKLEDPNHGIRFARKADAEAVIQRTLRKPFSDDAVATEHEWPDEARP